MCYVIETFEVFGDSFVDKMPVSRFPVSFAFFGKEFVYHRVDENRVGHIRFL